MKRRGGADGEVPRELLYFDEADWIGPNELDPRDPYIDPPAARWSRARQLWVRRNARSLADLNALYPADLVMPPQLDPRESS
jgi:hypothetical protein